MPAKKTIRIERPERDKEDMEIEAMLEDVMRKHCRPIVYNATLSEEKDFAEADKRLDEAMAVIKKKAAEARKKVG